MFENMSLERFLLANEDLDPNVQLVRKRLRQWMSDEKDRCRSGLSLTVNEANLVVKAALVKDGIYFGSDIDFDINLVEVERGKNR